MSVVPCRQGSVGTNVNAGNTVVVIEHKLDVVIL
jgi:excinuclease UvrABC ATPase subunit